MISRHSTRPEDTTIPKHSTPAATYRDAYDRLVVARVSTMNRDPASGDRLCRYVFEADTLDRFATLPRHGASIRFNSAWVKRADQGVLVEYLQGIANRAP